MCCRPKLIAYVHIEWSGILYSVLLMYTEFSKSKIRFALTLTSHSKIINDL